MKILLLHNNSNINKLRRSTLNFSFCMLKYAPEHTYFLHCYNSNPVIDDLKNTEFDVIILDVTFLEVRFGLPEAVHSKFLNNYDFIRNSKAVKLALPQDEFTKNQILQEWLTYWKVDAVFSPCYKQKDVLYSSLSNTINIVDSLTGFVDLDDVAIAEKYCVPFEKRELDISYRGAALDSSYGSFGLMKGQLSQSFMDAIKDINTSNIKIDVSNDKEYKLVGDQWLKFLCNSKFTLGCESGSSLLDPVGDIQTKVKYYVSKNPKASFEDVEANCFPGEDSKYIFNAISPRVFEAAMSKTCQILIEGEYSGVIKPWIHYIPIKKDFSNLKEIFEFIKNTEKVQQIIDTCYCDLIESGKYTYKKFTINILQEISKYNNNEAVESTNQTNIISDSELKKLLQMANYIGAKKGYTDINYIKKYSFFKQNFYYFMSLIYNRY